MSLSAARAQACGFGEQKDEEDDGTERRDGDGCEGDVFHPDKL